MQSNNGLGSAVVLPGDSTFANFTVHFQGTTFNDVNFIDSGSNGYFLFLPYLLPGQTDVIEPHGLITAGGCEVGLEGYVQTASTLADGAKIDSDIVAIAVKCHSNEVGLPSAALEFPGEMVPSAGTRRRTANAG